ncbi:hypothetical protein [Terriglobus sp. RCC_193]|uniref:hypothetical protein n=1 Tax=Terriglobus sp. RCC_193 TaxID=3239218 RepID=UPI0035232F83
MDSYGKNSDFAHDFLRDSYASLLMEAKRQLIRALIGIFGLALPDEWDAHIRNFMKVRPRQ